jgi:hypothetical protein
MGEWIDTLARWMAGELPRRAALRRIGGGLAATALAALVPIKPARADDPGLAICLEACGEIQNAKHQKRCRTSCEKCRRRGIGGKCVETTEGGSPACAKRIAPCAGLQSCASSHDCPETVICAVNTECGSGGVCLPVCNA